MAAWISARDRPTAWVFAAVFEALAGASHGYPLLVTGCSTLTLFIIDRDFQRTLRTLVKGHALAFCLLGGWLWPMLEMHGFTVPNDGAVTVGSWRELLPRALWPVAVAGLIGVAMWQRRGGGDYRSARRGRQPISRAPRASRRSLAGRGEHGARRHPLFPAGLAVRRRDGGDCVRRGRGGGCDAERACANVDGRAGIVAAALMVGQALWLAADVTRAQEWSLVELRRLRDQAAVGESFPPVPGHDRQPRFAAACIEHDPANNDLGSTRSLEALPMFLGGRPVLEGLYMESALLSPEVYWLQSEDLRAPVVAAGAISLRSSRRGRGRTAHALALRRYGAAAQRGGQGGNCRERVVRPGRRSTAVCLVPVTRPSSRSWWCPSPGRSKPPRPTAGWRTPTTGFGHARSTAPAPSLLYERSTFPLGVEDVERDRAGWRLGEPEIDLCPRRRVLRIGRVGARRLHPTKRSGVAMEDRGRGARSCASARATWSTAGGATRDCSGSRRPVPASRPAGRHAPPACR